MSEMDTRLRDGLGRLYWRTIVVLVLVFCVGAAFMIWQATLSHARLVRSAVLHEAAHHSELLSEFRTLYTSEVVAPAAAHGLEVTHDYESSDGAIPLPATLSILLGERITRTGKGGRIRLYSDHPFPWRNDGGPRDAFETEALRALRQNPDEPFYRFEKSDGRDVLRYASADVMRKNCVSCHNSHPDSSKIDWKVGDVRGVLEVTLPMDAAIAQAGTELQGTLVLVGGAGLFGLLGIVIVIRKFRTVSVDLEERVKERTAELEKSRERERQREQQVCLAVEAAPNGMVMINDQGAITLVNTKIEEMFGYDRSALLGQPIEILVPVRFRAEHPEYRRRFFQAPEVRPMGEGRDLFGVRSDGSEFPVELGLNPIQTENGIMALAAVVDITQRKKAEQQITDALEALKRKNRDLDEFSYVASHDLQEPLRKLVSFSQLLREDVGADINENAERDLGFIMDAAQRMQNLVRDLLTLSRAGRSAVNVAPISVAACAEQAVEALDMRVQETGAKINYESLPQVIGDACVLTQLYQNLIGNALKFVPSGRSPQICLTAERDGDKWILGVKDNGIGIKADHRERIFMPFQRLHGRGEYEGTGIGLAICRKNVERLGGEIWIESEPGVSSHFKFTIPLKPTSEKEEVERHEFSDELPISTENSLGSGVLCFSAEASG